MLLKRGNLEVTVNWGFRDLLEFTVVMQNKQFKTKNHTDQYGVFPFCTEQKHPNVSKAHMEMSEDWDEIMNAIKVQEWV